MIRYAALLLALLMPLQMAWAAAAAYCEHEPASSRQASHFGHHFHTHKSESKSPSTSKLAADPDCTFCHAASTPALISSLDGRVVASSTALTARSIRPAFSSAPTRAPDRPQWLRLV